jgi:photosystem II stability/assembly factor-like uncharacterized protein
VDHRAFHLFLVRRTIVKANLSGFLLFITVGLTASSTQSPAQPPGNIAPIAAFDLVAPRTGWAASSTHLYWTVSNGRRWRDITPPRASEDEPIQLAHFTNRHHGWALLINAVENQPTSLEIENTNDAGASWKLASVDLSHTPIDPAVPPSIDSMSFSDYAHGWILINTSSPRVRSGVLVGTADAGCHWRILGSIPMDGNISFSSASNGVLTVSSPNGNVPAWHTRDRGRSWAASDLPSPANCPRCIPVHLESAHFSNANRAILRALVKTPCRDDLSSVEYVTSNGGATWKPITSTRNARALISSPEANLVSMSQHKHTAKIITPRASRIERPTRRRHQQAPKALIIHCTLVSDRNAHDQAASNDIIRANATKK